MSLVRIDPASVLSIRRLASTSHLFGILDATDEPRVPELARALGPGRAVSLYRGTADERLLAIAPYLVQLDVVTFDWLTRSLWADPWGILAFAPTSLPSLHQHFRRLLTVVGPDGTSVLFRFYDPRVMASFLPTCSGPQLRDMFGPADWLGWTDWDSYGVVVCRRSAPDPSTTDRKAAVRIRVPPPPTR